MDDPQLSHRSSIGTLANIGLCLIVIALGAVVIGGWYLNNTTLIQINPNFAPMQFNTALCFLLSGIGLAFCFMLTATALILGSNPHYKRWVQGIASTLCLFVFLSFLGYSSNPDNVYGWGTLTRMAVHTTSGFFIIACVLFLHARRLRSRQRFNVWDTAPIASFVLLITMTFFAWHSSEEYVARHNQKQFESMVDSSQKTLLERYHLYEQALLGGTGLMKASNFVSREEWRTYVEALNVDQRLPGINGVGYIDYVLEQDLDSYLEEMRSDGTPNYANHPETKFSNKFIIRYSEPVSRNKEAIGLDIGFEKNRREAAETSIDTALPALTKKIGLVQDNKKRAGFLMLVPVYEGEAVPDGLEARRDRIQGWVYAPFIGEDFLTGISDFSKGELAFTVYDGDKSEDNIIHSNVDNAERSQINLTHTTTIDVAQNKWVIEWVSTSAFVSERSHTIPFIFLVAGLFLTALTTGVFVLLARMNGHTAMVLSKSRQNLQEALQFQNLISENIPDLIFVKDEEFRIVQANPAFLGLYPEDKRDQVIGYTTLEEYNDEDAKEFLKYDQMALDDGYSETEERIEFPNGDVKTLFTKKVRFENVEGEKFILGVGRDITQNKKAEDEIIRSNEELERFAYIASHDLQEPLRMVSNFTGLLNEEYGADMDEQARQYMDFSMVIEETDAKITVGRMPKIYAHPMRFSRLVQNLIGNAIKYRDPSRTPEIKIKAKERDKDWLFSVADNGMGIKEEYLEQIFVIFKRLHHKQDYSGTGLGLAISKKIVEGFQGQLWVESTFGKGSVFYFTIPKHE